MKEPVRFAGRKTLEVKGASTFLLWACALCLTCCLASAAKLRIGVKPGLQYDPVALHVQPGEKVELLFDNVDEMMHNFVLVSPGARMEIVESAIALGADGPARNYIPDSPDVLASTSVVLPGKKATIIFDAPAQEGEYPYVCTFPGHGFVMYGTLFVAKERPQKMDQVLAKAATGTPTQIILATPATSATAIVHRTFMPDSSPAAIAVSLPGGHSYCWDAGNCRLRYVWRDGFIKKNGSFGRWRTLPTIEGRVYHREVGFPFRFSNRNGHDPKTSFKGYRIVGGIPEFHYHADEAEVTEFITKLPGKSGLIRRFHVKHAPGDLLFEIDPDAGVKTTCDKGRIEGNHLRLSPREAIQFTLTQRETPGKAPLLYLSMNDLAACYNRKGDLHEGAIGQSWRLNGGKSVTPAQTIGDYSQGSTLAAWVKLSDPKRSIPALFGWKKGGQVHYVPSRKSYSFGVNDAFEKQTANGLEAEQAKFKGPTRSSTQGGHLGDGYLDFGTQVGEFVEWTVKVDKAGPYTLRFRYASSADRPLKLSVDGKTDILSPTLPFKNSGGWSSWKYLDIKRNLASGNHLVRLTSVKPFGPNLDRLEILAPGDEKKNNPKTNQLSPPDDAPTIDDTWHFIAMCMDAQSIRLFVDGELHEERVRKIDSPSPEGLVTLGSSKSHSQFYIDELRVYERVVGQNEIKRLMKPRAPQDR